MAEQKKLSFGSRLKRLFRRKPAEIDPPRITTVRCHIEIEAHDAIPRTSPTIRIHPPFEIGTRDFRAELAARIVVHPHHSLQIPVHALPVATISPPVVHRVTADPVVARINHLPVPQPEVAVTAVPCALELPRFHAGDLILSPMIHTDRARALQAPFRLRLHLLASLPKRLQIRYRVGALKKLDVSPREIEIIGVVFGLPSAPIELIDLETDRLDGTLIAVAARTGRFNAFMGGRAWVITRLRGENRFRPVALEQE